MLRRLILKNFQCHEHLELKLGKITVLTGDNDAGKSAIIRALRWLVLNEWEGEANDFITWGQSMAEVSLELEGHTIIRSKSASDNSYSLDDERFPKFGTQVPEKIRTLLALGPDNFQDQHDLPYWLLLNSSQAAKALNQIFNLSEIDSTLGNIAVELRSARSKETASRSRLEEARQELRSLAWVKKAERGLIELERLAQQIQETEDELQRLAGSLNEMEDLEQQIQERESELRCLEELMQLGREYLSLQEQISSLERTRELERELCRKRSQLEAEENTLARMMKSRCPLCGREP